MESITNNNEANDMKEETITPLSSSLPSSTPEILSVCRWYDKWSAINDEDGVVSR